ncbi:MAG: hypothetical protein GC159_18825 [Phycisphaera sp.]|nr:hypothetical protein [Phycisphaera sp.]
MILLAVYLVCRAHRRGWLDDATLLSAMRTAGFGAALIGVTVIGAIDSAHAADRHAGAADRRADAAEVVTAEQLMPLRAASARFTYTTNEGAHGDAAEGTADASQTVQVKIVAEDDARWRVDHATWKSQALRRGEGGSIVLMSERLTERDSDVRTTPGIAMLPGELREGQPITTRAKVRVTDLEGKHVKAEGEYTRRVEFIGRRVVETPLGSFDTRVVRTTEHFDFPLASADVVTTTSYLLGAGPVQQRIDKSVTKLGVFTDTSTRTLTLAEAWRDE